MSKTFSVPMPMVASTTTRAGRIVGTVTNRNMPQAPTPSSRAASTMSSGIALIEAERTVIAKPAWIQIMTMIRKTVFQGELMRNWWGLKPSLTRISLSRPVCLMPGWSGRKS